MGDGAESEQRQLDPFTLGAIRALVLSHTNYGHVEGNRRAFAILRELDQRLNSIGGVANG